MSPSEFRELPEEDRAEMMACMKVTGEMRGFDAQQHARDAEKNTKKKRNKR
tara:strand:- start:72 stop:224 length:153 start_codon:yes stop_codon:yes gene_type:complete